MLREFILQPNEDKRIQVEGRYLVITQATGPVELTIGGTTPITVDVKDRIFLRDSVQDRAIRIRNVSGGVNTIEIHTSDLLVDKRTGVDVKNEIMIAEQQRIGIDPDANIVQAIVQNAVKLDGGQNTVKLDSDNNTVKLDPSTKIEIVVTQPRRRYRVLPTVFFENGTNFDIPGKAEREKLILSAPNHNINRVWLSTQRDRGIPLHPAERIELDCSDSIKVFCPQDAANELYVGEIVRVL